jgi:multicomponent Na+:H+ antiporter subunit B
LKKLVVLLLLAFAGWFMWQSFALLPFGENRMNPKLSGVYLNQGIEQTGSANIVTAIVVNYRGFDTLGEVTVLFLSATALGAILFSARREERHRIQASQVVQTGAHLLFPLIVVLGAYVFIHGHLTPGGGFQGGTIIATGVLLMMLAYRSYHVNHRVITWLESLAGLTFVTVGLLGLVYGTSFLENFLPFGVVNRVFSAGIIPVIYSAVGIKVGVELIGLLDRMLETIK